MVSRNGHRINPGTPKDLRQALLTVSEQPSPTSRERSKHRVDQLIFDPILVVGLRGRQSRKDQDASAGWVHVESLGHEFAFLLDLKRFSLR